MVEANVADDKAHMLKGSDMLSVFSPPEEKFVSKFIIQPHFRLQEWVAEDKGYFRAEGLDYIFQEEVQRTEGKAHDSGSSGAYQTFEKGRTANISCACHWTVDVAAAKGHGKLYRDAYSVSPSGIFVPRNSTIESPEQLAGVPISVGYQSGSHYATIQGLEQYMPTGQIRLSFSEGMLFNRMDLLTAGKIEAAALFSGPYYFAEQLGFRKILDTTFMIATMITGDPNPEDIQKFFRALRRAQHDIDLRPDLYTHFYKNEFPTRYHAIMDTRRWGPGERIVFEPYTREVFDETVQWISARGIFEEKGLGAVDYDGAILKTS